MSGSKKKAAEAAETTTPETTWIRALRPLDVDLVPIAEGDTAEIRAELVRPLVDLGAAEVVDAPAEKA